MKSSLFVNDILVGFGIVRNSNVPLKYLMFFINQLLKTDTTLCLFSLNNTLNLSSEMIPSFV